MGGGGGGEEERRVTLSLIPYIVTMARASLVEDSMSLAAPETRYRLQLVAATCLMCNILDNQGQNVAL